jgi:hypothetical protein
MKRLHCLQHIGFEPPGAIGAWARERGIEMSASHLYRGDALPEPGAFDGLVIMGGPMNIYQDRDHSWLKAECAFLRKLARERKHKMLGICLGSQLLADALGGRVLHFFNSDLSHWESAQKTGDFWIFLGTDDWGRRGRSTPFSRAAGSRYHFRDSSARLGENHSSQPRTTTVPTPKRNRRMQMGFAPIGAKRIPKNRRPQKNPSPETNPVGHRNKPRHPIPPATAAQPFSILLLHPPKLAY